MAQTGFGTKLGYRPLNSASGTPYIYFATLVKISPPKITAGKADAGTLFSTFKPYVPTTPEGEGSFQIQFVPGDQVVLTIRGNISKAPIPGYDFQVLYLNGDSDPFQAYPLTYEPDDIERENVMMATITYTLIEPPTYTVATPPSS